MAYTPNPYLQRVGHYDDAQSIEPDTSSTPTDMAAATADAGRSTLTNPAQGASQAPGTQFGSALRGARKTIGNQEVAGLNTALRAGAAVTNAASFPARAAGGFVRDTYNAAVNNEASPNAGQPLGGVSAPQLKQPFPATPVNFALTHDDVPAPVRFGDVTGGVSSTAPAQQAAGAPATALQNPAAAVSTLPTATAAVPSNVDSGVDIGGRHLNYGATVNGVPTFSDGSAGIPQTVGKVGMAELAKEKSIGRADPGALGNALASDALGYTPSSDQMVAQNVAQGQLRQPITGSRPSAQDFADADRTSIALRDPRSAAGIAARNLSLDAQYGSSRTRRSAQQSLASLEAGTNQSGLAAQQAQSQSGLLDQQGSNELANTALRGQNQLAVTDAAARVAQLNRPGSPVTLADGTLALINPVNGDITASRQADGTPAKSLVARDDATTKRSNDLMDAIGKTASELAKNALPPPGAPAGWQPDAGAMREQAARFQGLPVVKNQAGQAMANINGQWVML